jgi:hydroxypyruvate reductase
LLSAGTDGTDGPGTDAGALVDGGTLQRGIESGLDAQASLEQADSGSFLEETGDLISTGPTGTNVMDLVIAIKS